MAINIKNLQERIQKKIFSVSPSTPTADLGDIVEAATLATGSLRQYDSAGLLPSVTSTQAQIAYTKKDNAIKHKSANTTTWKTLTSDAYAAGAAAAAPSTPFQSAGSSRAYIANGLKVSSYSATVEKYLFAASANATNVSGLTLNWAGSAVGGSRSTTDGYAAGGYTTPGARVKTIDKFPFASEDAVSDQGDVLSEKNFLQSMPIVSTTHGYFVGGFPSNNQIQKFAFASTGNTTDTGDLINSHNYGLGTNSAEYGYSLQDNTNQRWPFASDGNAVDVGDTSPTTSNGINRGASFQTTAIGYYAGGRNPASPGTLYSHIQKFPFASGTVNMTDTTYDLSDSKIDMMSASSSTHGYRAGGTPPAVNVIERYTFASEANVADVGDLTAVRYLGASSYV